MKPVLVVEHLARDGPGHFGEWLARHGIAARCVRVHAGDAVPPNTAGLSGLCVLGGDISVNDDLAHIRDETALVADALRRGVPVIGHCLGGQMLARALGATVGRSPRPELGWQPIDADPLPEARDWLGSEASHVVMQWHYEAFALPEGALRLASSAACPNQAFLVGGLHLGMQFHVEADAAKIAAWLASDTPELQRLTGLATVQQADAIAADCPRRLPPMRALAERIYDRWALGLRR